MTQAPTLVIAGTHSGVGKTSFAFAFGFARALARRGLKVQTFKVGPDFLDPTYLALDGWMAGTDHCLRLGVARDAAFHLYYQDLFDALDAEEKKTLGDALATAIQNAVGKRTEERRNVAVVLIDLGGRILGSSGDLIPWR
jgi:hypothetical protein